MEITHFSIILFHNKVVILYSTEFLFVFHDFVVILLQHMVMHHLGMMFFFSPSCCDVDLCICGSNRQSIFNQRDKKLNHDYQYIIELES